MQLPVRLNKLLVLGEPTLLFSQRVTEREIAPSRLGIAGAVALGSETAHSAHPHPTFITESENRLDDSRPWGFEYIQEVILLT